MKNYCQNMNHGRSNIPLRYCPSCGEKLNATIIAKCNSDKHTNLRKNRHQFCTDCGVKLSEK